MSGTVFHVNIGQIQLGTGTDVLHANLGSCVGIGFIWPQKKKTGLAHCFLPERKDGADQVSARYVSDAIPSLLKLMNIGRLDRSEIKVIVAGGADRFASVSSAETVGNLNILATRKYLKLENLIIDFENVGGSVGRHLVLNNESLDFEINEFSRQKGA